MFGSLFAAVRSVADLADATVGLVVAPVKEGVDLIADSVKEITTQPEE